jgi:transglutaminase-like putative cysteine protease
LILSGNFLSMLFHISHRTNYSYNRPVFLEPHVLRLRPRSDGTQQLIRFGMRIAPEPAGLTPCSDLAGNATVQTWYEGTTDSLEVVTDFELETLRSNPFDYILTQSAAKSLPLSYAGDFDASLSVYRSGAGIHDSVIRFAASVAEQADWQTLPFLAALTSRIQESCEQIIREEGEPQPPEVSLEKEHGSCRDLTVLFMAACRSQGIAARFVSGYQEGDPDQEKRYLHAWAEVYLPGGGWRGYDPSLGLAVADRHIALAAAAVPALAVPVSGSFRGTGTLASMHAEIDIRTDSGERQKR